MNNKKYELLLIIESKTILYSTSQDINQSSSWHDDDKIWTNKNIFEKNNLSVSVRLISAFWSYGMAPYTRRKRWN